MQRIAQLLEDLKDTSKPEAVWKDAAKRLRQIGGAEVITALGEALTDDNKLVRARAAKALGSIRSNLAAVQLAEALKDPYVVVRANASQALKHISTQEILRIGGGKQIVAALLEAIDDENSLVRVRVVDTLRLIGGNRALDALKRALKDKDSFVRSKAAYALGSMQSNEAWKDLAEALRDEESTVRSKAAEALGKIRDTIAGTKLVEALRDSAPSVRANSAWSLGQIGFSSATPDLIEASRDPTSGSVRANAVLALGQIGDPRAVLRVAEAAKDDDPGVREKAVDALGRLGRSCVKRDVRASEQAITALVEVLKSERNELHEPAAEALRHIADNKQLIKRAVTTLVDALLDIGRKKALAESRVERERYIRGIYETVFTEGPYSKGKALETLIAALFSSVDGFIEEHRNIRTKTEEIDIMFRNESKHPTWQKESSYILVECKNWRHKRVGKNEFVLFKEKLENFAGRCKLGFLVCVEKFAGTITQEMLRSSKTDCLVVLIDGKRLQQLVDSENRNQLLLSFLALAITHSNNVVTHKNNTPGA